MTQRPAEKLLELRGITKRFEGTVALENVDFDLLSGEVHVLFGENGAGKSTLINVIAGTFPHSSGVLIFRGKELARLTPTMARTIGISSVFQEFSLFPQLTVTENLFIGRELSRHGILDLATMASRTAAILRDLHFFSIAPEVVVGDLSRAQQQMVEIAKALLLAPRILILDEPTASLTEAETTILFNVISHLKATGVGIIYVSHRMQEIRALADRVTVLRDGRKVATIKASDASDGELIALMVGRQIKQLYPSIKRSPGRIRISATGLTLATDVVKDANLTLRAGEIVGIGGLIGSGKSEFVRALFGLEPIRSGHVVIDDELVAFPTPEKMIERKVCYFPADRVVEGLALQRNIRENASITALSTAALSFGPFLRKANERSLIQRLVARLQIRPRETETKVGSLSGGNRQKVMLARGLARPTEVFLLEEPTIGIDVGAKLEVYEVIKALVEEGGAVLLVSSDLPELLHLSHQLLIFSGGRIVAQLEEGSINEEAALSHFFTRGVGHSALADAA